MSEFSKSLLKIIVAQIVKDSGFDGISTSSCSVLIDIAERYLLLLAQLTLENAKHRDCIQVNLLDAILSLDQLLVTTTSLNKYWEKWGIRIPTNKLQAHKERGAATAGSGNAIIEAILGIRKPVVEEEKPALPKEVSGFFRMEPGPFPLGISLLSQLRLIDVDRLLGDDYSPETIQTVPSESLALIMERKEEEMEEESSQKKLFLYPSSFSDSVYYQGTVSEYVGHEFKPIEGETGKSRGKISSKTRKLFSRAYRSFLDGDSDPFHVDPSQSLLTLQGLQKTCLDRLRFSTVIPEASIAGFSVGFLEEIYTYYLPELNGCKRALPQYKDDKKALRKELRALEAARLEPSTADYPMRCHQDIINTYAAMTEESKPQAKADNPDVTMIDSAPSQIPFSQPMSTPAAPLTQTHVSLPSNQGKSHSDRVPETPQTSERSGPTPDLQNTKRNGPPPAGKIKLKIKQESAASPLKITIAKPRAPSVNESMNISKPSPSNEAPQVTSTIDKPDNGPKSGAATPDGQIKCICQHSTVDFGRFMIACDNCGIWFHGECVKVTAESIQFGAQWLCLRCSVD